MRIQSGDSDMVGESLQTSKEEKVANGTIRECDGKICIYMDGYWIRYYAPPPNTGGKANAYFFLATTRLSSH